MFTYARCGSKIREFLKENSWLCEQVFVGEFTWTHSQPNYGMHFKPLAKKLCRMVDKEFYYSKSYTENGDLFYKLYRHWQAVKCEENQVASTTQG